MKSWKLRPIRLPGCAARGKYDAFSSRYDWIVGTMEGVGIRRMRKKLLRHARGEVLEVAVGTGINLPHYPKSCVLQGIDFSPGMISFARRRSERLDIPLQLEIMDAENLEFPDGRFDTVVSTLATSTFPDPVKTMREMGRVLRPGGIVLLLEMGYATHPCVRRLQDWRAEKQFQWLGSRWNREPDQQAHQAGLTLESDCRAFLGAVHAMILGGS